MFLPSRGDEMSTELDVLEAEALKLTVEERAQLAQVLWGSLSGGPPDTDERRALEDARRRDAEMTSGKAVGKTHSEVIKDARRSLK
jgi:hypothetical protein